METQTDIETIVDGRSWIVGVNWEETPLPRLVDLFENAHGTFESFVSRTGRGEYEKVKRQRARAHYAFEGRLTPEAEKVAESAVTASMKHFDARMKSEADTLLKLAPVLQKATEAWVDDSKRVREPNHEGQRRMIEIEEKKELRLRYNGRPLRELLSFYKSASDGDAVRFVEQEYREGWPTLQPAINADDAAKFNAAINAREEARVPEERRRLQDRVTELMNPTRTVLLKQAAGHFSQVLGA